MPGGASSQPSAAAGFDPLSRILFPAPAASYSETSFPGELLWIPRLENAGATAGRERVKRTPPEEKIPCLFLKYTSARFIVFYLHTNAEDLGKCHTFCSCVRAQFQVHVFAVEYPGYGICPGGPCDERGLTENAFAGLHFLREALSWPLDSILVVGRSIGCGPAISLGVRYQVSGMVVISPMLSFRELVKDLVGPLSNIVAERFPNRSRMQFVRSSVLVVHGQKDATVPFRHGLELFRSCKSRKLFVGPEDMGHNANMFSNVSYMVMPMLHFFALPDYCFEDINVPGWAYDRYSDLDLSEQEQLARLPAPQLRAKVAPQPATVAPAPPRPEAPQPPSDDTAQDKQLQEGAASPEASPRGLEPRRPITIRVPPNEEQERTASRSMLAQVSDRPLPPMAAVQAQALLPPLAPEDTDTCGLESCQLPPEPWLPETDARPGCRPACGSCLGCPAGPHADTASASWEDRQLDAHLLESSGCGRGL